MKTKEKNKLKEEVLEALSGITAILLGVSVFMLTLIVVIANVDYISYLSNNISPYFMLLLIPLIFIMLVMVMIFVNRQLSRTGDI